MVRDPAIWGDDSPEQEDDQDQDQDHSLRQDSDEMDHHTKRNTDVDASDDAEGPLLATDLLDSPTRDQNEDKNQDQNQDQNQYESPSPWPENTPDTASTGPDRLARLAASLVPTPAHLQRSKCSDETQDQDQDQDKLRRLRVARRSRLETSQSGLTSRSALSESRGSRHAISERMHHSLNDNSSSLNNNNNNNTRTKSNKQATESRKSSMSALADYYQQYDDTSPPGSRLSVKKRSLLQEKGNGSHLAKSTHAFLPSPHVNLSHLSVTDDCDDEWSVDSTGEIPVLSLSFGEIPIKPVAANVERRHRRELNSSRGSSGGRRYSLVAPPRIMSSLHKLSSYK